MDKEFWQSRYEQNQTGWDLGKVSTPLKEYFDQLSNHSLNILIPGCGNGYEAIYLANLGFTNVHALDLVAEPLNFIKKNTPQVTCIQASIFNHCSTYDLIIEQTLFCAINPSSRKEYLEKIHSLLNPGGKYVGLLFDRSFEGGPPFGGSKKEYESYLNGLFHSYQLTPCYNSIPPRMNSELFIIAKK